MEFNLSGKQIYEKAVETFIDYLESKQQDTYWLMGNHKLIEEMFKALYYSEEPESLLPALKILEKDPCFSELLEKNILNLILHHTLVA